VNVGTGGAGETQAMLAFFNAQNVGASGAKHQHDRKGEKDCCITCVAYFM